MSIYVDKIFVYNVCILSMQEGTGVEKDILVEGIINQKYIELQERYEKILQLSNDAIFMHNNGEIVYANPRAYKFLEAEKETDILGRSVFNFIHKDYHEIVKKRIQITRESEENRPPVEEAYLTVTGKVKIAEVTASSVPYEGVRYNLIIVKDISENKKMEAYSKEKDEMLRLVTENTLDLLSVCGKDFCLTYVTPSHFKILGFTAEELIGVSGLDFIHIEDTVHFLEGMKSAAYDGQDKTIQWRCLCKDGGYKNLESHVRPIYNRNSLEGFVISSRDLTERTAAEDALRKSEKKYRELFNNVNDAIYLYKLRGDDVPGEFVEVNDVACDRLGYTREELRNMTVKDFNPYQTMDIIDEIKERLLEKGYSIHRAVNRTKNGKHIPVEVNSILMTLNDEKCVLSICRDITEREEIERQLRISKERYKQLIESLPYGIYMRTIDRMLFSNRAGLEYLGVKTIEEMRNKLFSEFAVPHPSYEEQLKNNIQEILSKGSLPPSEERYIRLSDNKVLDMETIVTRCNYDSDEDTFLVVTRDISDKKKAEELEKHMVEKSKQLDEAFEYEKLRTEFFANISHELRTPVNVIFSTIQLISLNMNSMDIDYSSKEKFKKHMKVMKQNCHRLIRLINNLIDVSRIDTGFFNLSLSNNNIVSVVEDITLSIAEYIENKDISLIFDTEVEEKFMSCDPDMIERIMLNLISNAVKFTDRGGSVLVSVIDKEDTVLISVKDTGIGISVEKQRDIFERFIQVDKSLTRNREGSGIGLSLVKALVELHQGSISVKSSPGAGSEFIIQLPVKLVEDCSEVIETQRLTAQDNIEKIDIEFSDIY